ncbi:unnamed protein product [Oppiella nova]|uniref:Uncharacterized protein n=1 Tax=Oppiella nova TaxID=334625 RepID=A0A7R9LW37_9ACAR|nr:unnamed protein product [Oppiella nova]CAG2166824.1 unnamed protein product [Oppiella nova]
MEYSQLPLANARDDDIICSDKNLREMDKAVTKLIVVGQRNLKFPTNERQLRPYCNHALKTFDQITAYNDKCLNKFGRDSAKVLMHSLGIELRAICKTGRLNKRARLIEKFTGVMNAPVKQRLPMCCWP